MAEYIDRQKVLKELECGIRAGNYEDGYEEYSHINDMDDCIDTVKHFDAADVIERSVIEDIKAEILDYEEEVFHRPNTNYEAYASVRYCLDIIDRHISGKDKE